MPNKTPVAKLPVSWILVADGRRAQVYTRMKGEKRIPLKHRHYDRLFVQELTPVPGMRFAAEAADIYEAGRPGRVFESVGEARHGIEPRLDIGDEIRLHLVRTIAERLNKALGRKLFDRLVLVAPPKMLGELREALNGYVKKRIVAELPKDLTGCDGSAVMQRLRNSGVESA